MEVQFLHTSPFASRGWLKHEQSYGLDWNHGCLYSGFNQQSKLVLPFTTTLKFRFTLRDLWQTSREDGVLSSSCEAARDDSGPHFILLLDPARRFQELAGIKLGGCHKYSTMSVHAQPITSAKYGPYRPIFIQPTTAHSCIFS